MTRVRCIVLVGAFMVILVPMAQACTNQLNLAIMYDDYEGTLVRDDGNEATFLDMSGLFDLKETPILLSGNLALRVGFLLNPPPAQPAASLENDYFSQIDRRVRLIDQPGRVFSEEEKKIECKKTGRLYNSITRGVFGGVHGFAKETAKKLTVGEAVSLKEALKKFKRIDDILSCSPAHDIESDLDKLKKKYFDGVDLSKWHIYLVKNSPHHFVLFIPNNYLITHNALTGTVADLAAVGFEATALEEIKPQELAEKTDNYDLKPEEVATSIGSIFLESSAAITRSLCWNVYIMGHGASPESGISPMQILLKKRDSEGKYVKPYAIAGLPPHEFLHVMELFAVRIPTNVVVYSTCHGGGANAEAIRQLFEVAVSLVSKAQLVTAHFPVVISLSGSEKRSSSVDIKGFHQFFDFLKKSFSLPVKTDKEKKELLQKACESLASDTPIILFPKQAKPVALREAVASDTLPTPAKFEKQEPHEFVHLKEPDYVLEDVGETLVLSGALVSPETTQVTTDEITFKDRSLDRIAFKTGAVTKKLIFETSTAPSFDIRVPDDRLTFTVIEFPHLSLSAFFANSFKGHGRNLRVSIDSCTANYDKLLAMDGFAEGQPITVSQVELVLLHSFMSNFNRSQILFTQADYWYFYNMSINDKEDIELKFFKKIAIPAGRDKQLVDHAQIIKQLEANAQLAQLMANARPSGMMFGAVVNVSELARWFAAPIFYQNCVNNDFLSRALDLITDDEATLKQALTALGPLGTKTMINTMISLGIFGAEELQKMERMSKQTLLNPERRKRLFSDALAGKEYQKVGALLHMGESLASVATDDLINILNFMQSDKRGYWINTLKETQKEQLLATALRDSNYVVAAELISAGVDSASISARGLVDILSSVPSNKGVYLLSKLSESQKKQAFKIAFGESKYPVVARLILAGVDSASLSVDDLVNILSSVPSDQIKNLVAKLDEAQINEAIKIALEKSKNSVAYNLAEARPAAVPDDRLFTIINFNENNASLISRLIQVQKNNVLAIALKKEGYNIARNLIKAGANMSASISAAALLQLFTRMTNDEIKHVIVDLSDEQKSAVLLEAFVAEDPMSEDSRVAVILMEMGALPAESVSPEKLVHALADHNMKEGLSGVITRLSDRQKTNALAVAVMDGRDYGIAAQLIKYGAHPAETVSIEALREVLKKLSGEDLKTARAFLSPKQQRLVSVGAT